jgi:hypothetical protein
MNYKDKYIKYKTKYLELKNMNINNQIGGGKNKKPIMKKIKMVEYSYKNIYYLNNVDNIYFTVFQNFRLVPLQNYLQYYHC